MSQIKRKNAEQLQRVRWSLLTTGVCALVLLASLLAWQMQADRVRTLASHAERLEALAVVVASDAEAALRTGVGVLAATVPAIRQIGGPASAREGELHRLLRQQLQHIPDHAGVTFHEMWVVDASGTIVAASSQFPLRPVSVADREYFLHHRDQPDRQPHLGALTRSRLSGEMIIPSTLRLEDERGHFLGVVGVTLHAGYFERIYGRIKGLPGTSIALTRLDGGTLFRYPSAATTHAPDAADVALFRDALASGRHRLEIQRSPYDGEPRLVGLRQGDRFPLVAVVADKPAEVLAPWRRNALIYGLAAALAGLLVAGFGLFSARQLYELDRVMHLSLHDVLTGLPNRRFLERQLTTEWQRMARTSQPFSLLFIDIDHFKRYNDHYGHGKGDRCLRQVAQAMRAALKRAGDQLVRYGGEEFVCVLPNTDLAGARRFAQTLLDAVNRLALPHDKSPTAATVTISVGVASAMPRPGNDVEAVLRSADVALYEAKAAGRNRMHSMQALDTAADTVMPGSGS